MSAEDGEGFASAVEDSCHRDDTRSMTSYARQRAAMVADEVLGHGTGILEASEGGMLILNELDQDLGEDEVRV